MTTKDECRRCVLCPDTTHHWHEGFPEDEDGEVVDDRPEWQCRHCDFAMPYGWGGMDSDDPEAMYQAMMAEEDRRALLEMSDAEVRAELEAAGYDYDEALKKGADHVCELLDASMLAGLEDPPPADSGYEQVSTAEIVAKMGTPPRPMPSDILLRGSVPLTATFGKAEGEQMAALVIAVLAANGEGWRPVRRHEIGLLLRSWIKHDSAPEWARSGPFFRPNTKALEAGGYVAVVEDTIEFTEKGLDALRDSRWNKKARTE